MYIPFARDTLQKLSLIAFSQAMLIVMDDSRKVVGFYPTELIIPTFRRKLMDGVLELEDGTLLDVEFHTGNLTEKVLLKSAQYAVNLRVISEKQVETRIISTGSKDKSKTKVLISDTFSFKPELFFYSEMDGMEKLINIKNKINNGERLTSVDCYDLVFIPFMGNVDEIESAFEVFEIANNAELFSEDKQIEIKQCQYIVANIVADDNDELLNKFWRIIKMNNDFLIRYENDLIDRTTKEVTQQVTQQVTEQVTQQVTEQVTQQVTEQVTQQVTEQVTEDVRKTIAKNLKDMHSDEEIAKITGLSLEEVKKTLNPQ